MATQVQRRRGTTAENDVFTGALAELTVDTDLDELRVHDGARAGGFNTPNFSSLQKRIYSYDASPGGTATAITCSTQVDAIALTAGLEVTLKMGSTATGASTITWGSLTTKDVKKYLSGAKADIEADDWVTSQEITFQYDGTDFVAQLGGGGSGGLVDSGTWTGGSPTSLSFDTVFEANKSYTVHVTGNTSIGVQMHQSGGSYLTGAYYDHVQRHWQSDGTNTSNNNNDQSSIVLPGTKNVLDLCNPNVLGGEYAGLSYKSWTTTGVQNRTKVAVGAAVYLFGSGQAVDGIKFTGLTGDGEILIYEG